MDTAEHFKRIDTTLLDPVFFGLLKQLVANCEARGYTYIATEGHRSLDRQKELYAKGRNEHGEVVNQKEVVTNAKPGSSFHHYFIACDFVLDTDKVKAGVQPSWKEKDYKVLGEEAKKLGLDAGVFWKNLVDAPHVQIDVAKLGLSIAILRQLHAKRGDSGIRELLKARLVAA